MKSLIVILLMVSGLSANPYDEPHKPFLQQDDKQLHMGFSFVVGIAGNAICYQEFGLTEEQSWWCGLGAALLVGAAKEIYDTNFDWEDMGANAIGGTLGTTGLYTIYKW